MRGSRCPYEPKRLMRLAIATVVAVAFASAAASQTRPAAPSTQDVAGTTPDVAGAFGVNYRVNVGDVLEISIHGFPELRQKAMVELNGEVSLPPAGRIEIVDMTITEAQAAIRKLVTARPLRQKFGDGRETLTVVAADDVNVAIVEYRPVYVMGDVAKPGELPFRPGLSVRQAIALAGGFDIMRYRLVNPFLESADMKGKQETLWTEAAKGQVEIARIQAELDGTQTLDRSSLKDVPLDPGFIDRLVLTESETLKKRQESFAREFDHLKGLIRMAEDRARTLTATLENEERGLKEDQKSYADLMQFGERGSLPVLRLMDIKRSQVTFSSRVLQTRLQLEQAQREQAEAIQALARADSERRTGLLKDLQAASVKSNELQAQLSANAEKLTHTSLLKSRLVRGPDAKTKIRVFRSDHNAKQQIDAVEDTPLLPGDTIEIALRNEYDVEATRFPGASAER
jgi:polysaccharide biosynthesis/export protein